MRPMQVKVTVEYLIDDISTEDELLNDFNNDIEAIYKFVSDDNKDHPLNFTDKWEVVKIEVVNPLLNIEQDVQASVATGDASST